LSQFYIQPRTLRAGTSCLLHKERQAGFTVAQSAFPVRSGHSIRTCGSISHKQSHRLFLPRAACTVWRGNIGRLGGSAARTRLVPLLVLW
jgi:hypothetical protein